MSKSAPKMARADPAGFIRANTDLMAPPLAPEIDLHLASEAQPIWLATEADLDEYGLPPPYWAFAWAGGQALARYILDHPHEVRDRRVFDFASGSGLVAIAAVLAGASAVVANDIDPFALTAIALNAEANGVSITTESRDMIGQPLRDHDVILAGDVCYEQPMADLTMAWLRERAASGQSVLLGDPGRAYLPKTGPKSGMDWVIRYGILESGPLEDTDARNAIVWRVAPG